MFAPQKAASVRETCQQSRLALWQWQHLWGTFLQLCQVLSGAMERDSTARAQSTVIYTSYALLDLATWEPCATFNRKSFQSVVGELGIAGSTRQGRIQQWQKPFYKSDASRKCCYFIAYSEVWLLHISHFTSSATGKTKIKPWKIALIFHCWIGVCNPK